MTSVVSGQHDTNDSTGTDDEEIIIHHKSSHYLRIAAFLGHTLVALDHEGHRSPIPSWGLDIELWITHKFGIGLHNDVEVLNYVIEINDFESIEREYPVVITLDLLYRPWKNLVLFGGAGMEFEKNEDFVIYRIGIEYEIPFADNWDVCPTIFHDWRKDAFDTSSIMLGVGYSF